MINFNVTELIEYIKLLTTNDYVLNNLRIEGEVSNLNLHSNGNAYFSLKDEYSKINAIIYDFKTIDNIDDISTGSLVEIEGSVNILESDGSLRVTATSIKNIGVGNLYEEYLKIKSELEKEGYFSDKHKKEIPKFPKKIGVITSIDGAAIKDIYNVSNRRNPYIHIEHFPSLVQGNFAVQSLIRGLEHFEKSDVDLVIIGRGGGSYEDLNAFNSKELALKIFNFNKPIISAVGHEHDFTISDFVSDLRAPTPSAAAELAFFSHDDFIYKFNNDLLKINTLINNRIQNNNKELQSINKRLSLLSIDKIIDNRKTQLNDRINKINKIQILFLNKKRNETSIAYIKLKNKNLSNIIKNKESNLQNKAILLLNRINYKMSIEEKNLLRLNNRLEKLDFKSMLKQGYTITVDKDGNLIKNIDNINIDDNIKIILYDGNFNAKVTEKRAD